MAEKKLEPKKDSRKKFLKKLFTVSMHLILGVSGFFVGVTIQSYYLKGHYIPGGVGNTTKTSLAVYPNEVALNFPIATIEKATKEILIMAKTIQSKAMIDALSAKVKQGVRVVIILNKEDADASNVAANSPTEYMRKMGLVEVVTDSLASTQHTIIADGTNILVGNGGFSSRAAGNTSATFMEVRAPEEALKLREYFLERYQKSERLFN